MTKQVQQSITPTHVIGSTGTADTSDLGYRALDDFKGDLGLGTSLTQTANNGNGTAAAPAFTFTGDPDTGIYRPGADTLGFVTNGSEKVRINSAGNVGIGTSNPGSNKLHVVGHLLSTSFEIPRYRIDSFTGTLNDSNKIRVTLAASPSTQRGKSVFQFTYGHGTINNATMYGARFIVSFVKTNANPASLSIGSFVSIYNFNSTIGDSNDIIFTDNGDNTCTIDFPNKVGGAGNSGNTNGAVLIEKLPGDYRDPFNFSSASVI
jgi:hypothetical protein